jgi:peptidoglycan hydrolase-like protein with peptidoglycan-binding domain
MAKITRNQFVQRFKNKEIDLEKAADKQSAVDGLAETGKPLSDYAKHDLYDHDGKISGTREMRAIFNELRRLSPAGADSIQTTDAAGNPTKAGKALSMLGLLAENKTDGASDAAPLNTVGDPRFDKLRLTAAVGPGQPNNKEDVKKIQTRLRELGLPVGVDGSYGPNTQRGIDVYKSMLGGDDRTKHLEDRTIRPGDKTHQALVSDDAPRWQEMPKSGPGFVNTDWDAHDYGSSQVANVIKNAGQRYQNDYRSKNPGASLITTNDVSKKRGGDTKDHETHENGLDLDVRLPRTDGQSGTKINRSDYDKDATYAVLKAFGQDPDVERILFGDKALIQKARDNKEPWAHKLMDAKGHRDHIHVDIRPPKVSLPPLPESGNS